MSATHSISARETNIFDCRSKKVDGAIQCSTYIPSFHATDSIVFSLYPDRPSDRVYAVARSPAYACVLITGANRASEILYAFYIFALYIFLALLSASERRTAGVGERSDYELSPNAMYRAPLLSTTRGNNSSYGTRRYKHAHEQLIRVRFALIYYGALSRGRGVAREPMAHVEDIGIPAVGRLDKINTAVKRNAIKM